MLQSDRRLRNVCNSLNGKNDDSQTIAFLIPPFLMLIRLIVIYSIPQRICSGHSRFTDPHLSEAGVLIVLLEPTERLAVSIRRQQELQSVSPSQTNLSK